MSKQEQAPENSVPAQKGPGSRLQTARIEQGITIDEIARQMNLNKKILEALEEDQYDDLQSPIFIRGYLRTYSRLVGMDGDETIKIFSEVYQKSDPDIKSIRSTSPEISSNDVRVKWVTYIVVIGLVALISVWWMNSHQQATSEAAKQPNIVNTQSDGIPSNVTPTEAIILNEPTESIAETTSESNTASSADLNLQPSIEENPESITKSNPESNIDLNKDADIDSGSTASLEVNNAVEANENTPDLDKPAAIETKELPSSSLATQQEPPETNLTATQSNEATSEPIAESAVQPATPTNKPNETAKPQIVIKANKGKDELVIVVSATSWGDIKDANKQRLIKDLLKQGETYRFVGQKPFKVFLGNGYGVEVRLNGKIQDFSKSIKANNTARFELGK